MEIGLVFHNRARRRPLLGALLALTLSGGAVTAAPEPAGQRPTSGGGRAAGGATAPALGSAAGATSPTAPAAAPVAALDPSVLTLYFTEGPLFQATARLRSGDAKTAVQLIGDYVAKLSAEPSRTPAARPELEVKVEFLLAVAQLRAAAALAPGPERTTLARQAAQHFDRLAERYPLLKSYHALYGGRSYLLAQVPAESLRRLAGVPSDSVLDCDARFLRGEALRELGGADRERAVASYRGFLSACPLSGQTQRWIAQEHCAETLDALGRPAEALQLWRRLYIEAPTENFGTLAQRRFDKPGTRVPAFSAAELLERAQSLFDGMRNTESEAAYRWVLEVPDIDEAQVCVARYHLAQSVFKQRQRPRAAPLFDQAVTSCAPAAGKNDDLHMKSIYQAARCHASTGELQQAAELFAQAEAAHPGHSYADDSRLRQAEMYQDLADRLKRDGARKTCKADACPDYETQFAALLGDLPERYPDGDKRAEALWRLALRSYRRGELDKTRAWLEQTLQRVPRESGWDQEGRTLYWLGRVAQLQNNSAQALQYYRRTAQEYPLSFYTLLALNRVREGFAGEFPKLVQELYGTPRPDDEAFTFKPRALFALPGFWRGVELLRLGLGSEAKREWSAVGITVPESKTFQVAGAPPGGPTGAAAEATESARDAAVNEQTERLWLAAVLYDKAGAWHMSHFIPRHILTGWQRHYPVGPWRKQWLLAFPRGYGELLKSAAEQNGQPESLQVAIVREESAFDPLNESFANAIGLTQMIPPTAKRFAGGLPYDREALREPAINVAIGARFLGFLWKLMGANAALTISGYNAGEGAVFRWLKNSGSELREIDAFIESIPFDETRGYTKRVLSSYLTYKWLEPLPADAPPTQRVPELVFPLPPAPGAAANTSAATSPSTSAATSAPPSVTPAPVPAQAAPGRE